jgi:hypothetical protein
MRGLTPAKEGEAASSALDLGATAPTHSVHAEW